MQGKQYFIQWQLAIQYNSKIKTDKRKSMFDIVLKFACKCLIKQWK